LELAPPHEGKNRWFGLKRVREGGNGNLTISRMQGTWQKKSVQHGKKANGTPEELERKKKELVAGGKKKKTATRKKKKKHDQKKKDVEKEKTSNSGVTREKKNASGTYWWHENSGMCMKGRNSLCGKTQHKTKIDTSANGKSEKNVSEWTNQSQITLQNG
jgi:hypothetical protein